MSDPTISIHTEGKSDLAVSITDRLSGGRDFSFALKGNHLSARAGKKHGQDSERDWYKSLNELEKVQVMSKVLANYRKPTIHRDQWKVSAIGIIENTEADTDDEKKHSAFVGVNNDMRAETLDKDCAEQGVLNAMATTISQYHYHKLDEEMQTPAVPKEIHVMGGRAPNPNKGDKGEKMIAPCGKCTDTLGKWMDPESTVYVYPTNVRANDLRINDSADSLAEVRPGEVWKTTIGHLNRFRHVLLTTEQTRVQQEALGGLVEELMREPADVPESVITRAAENKRKRIDSVPELDVATDAEGTLAPAAANAHLHSLIVETLRTRMHRANIAPRPDAVRNWLMSDNIDNINATIVQYDDHTYTDGLKAQTAYDGSSASSQLSGVTNTEAVKKGGDKHVIRTWSMSFCPKDIEVGRTTTPSKEGVERIVKRMNGTRIEKPFVHFPFNNASLEPALTPGMAFSRKDLYPGGFKGGLWTERTAMKPAGICCPGH